MSFTQYAKHRGVSKSWVSKVKGRGLLDKAIVKKNGRPKVDSKKADKILDNVHDPNFTKGSPTDKVKALGKKKKKSKKKSGSNGDGRESGDQSFIAARIRSEEYKAKDQAGL